MSRGRAVSAAAAVLATLIIAPIAAAIDDFEWKTALVGAQLWQMDGNWVQPNFPNAGDDAAIVSVGADLTLDVGATDVAVAALTLNGTAAGTDINITGGSSRLVFQNDDNNTSMNPDPGSPDVDPILDHEGVNHGRVVVTTSGVAGTTNTIGAPIRLANNGFLEGVDFSGNRSITLSGNIDIVGTVAEDLGSLRSYLPTGTKLLVSGAVNLTDAGDNATARSLAINNYFTSDHAEPPRGTIEISGPISGAGGLAVGWNWDVDGEFGIEEDWVYDPAPAPGLPLGTVILSGANIFTGDVVLARGNLAVRHDNALGDASEAVFRQGGQSGEKKEVGYNLVVDAGDRKIANVMAVVENVTFKGNSSLEWSGMVYQDNGRTLINMLPYDFAADSGETLTFSGPMYPNRRAENPPEPGRILMLDGAGKTIISGGIHDQLTTVDDPPESPNRIGYLAKRGTGAVVVDGRVFDDMGSQIDFNDTDYAGHTFVEGGSLHFHANEDLGGNSILSSAGAVGVDSGVIGNSTFLEKLNSSANPNGPVGMAPFFLQFDVTTPIFTTFSSGGLILGTNEYDQNLDFAGTQEANPLARAANMTLAAQQGGSTYTGTITPSTTVPVNPNTYQLGGGSDVLTLPNANQLTGTRSLLVTNGGEVRLQGVNSYTGTTRVVAKYRESLQDLAAADSGDPDNDGRYDETVNQIRIDSTLTVSHLTNGGSASSIGSSSGSASNLLIQGSTLKYVGGATSTDRLLTVGTAGATIDASGSGALVFSNAGALGIDVAENRTGFIHQDVLGLADNEIFGRPTLGVPFSTEDLVPGMRIQSVSGSSVNWVDRLVVGAVPAPDVITVGPDSNDAPTWTGFTTAIGARTIDFGPAPARFLTLSGTNTGDNTLAPLVGDAADVAETGGGPGGAGSVGIRKTGVGKWILAANNTYTGATNVEGGTLLVNGNQTGGGLATVSAGASFGGTGQIGGSVTMVEGSMYTAAFASGTIDPLAVLGDLDLSALGNVLNVAGTGVGSSWTLLTYAGTLAGTFESSPGYTVDYGTGSNSQITLMTAGVAADYNNNGVVDAADYTIWRDHLGQTFQLQNEGGITPGLVNAADYAFWKSRFGATSGAGSGGLAGNAAVPEPAGLMLAGIALVGISIVRRRRDA